MGHIVTSISLDIDLWNETNAIREDDQISMSRYTQTAIRHHNKRMRKLKAAEYLDSLNESEMNILKEEIKKRSR